MKLREIYDLAIEMGVTADPRGREVVEKELAKAKKAYEKLETEDKELFDMESLHNPYADTRILHGEDDREISKILCGIDIECGEISVAAQLNSQGAGIDLLLAHHPEGAALAALADVMDLQTGYMAQLGVLPNIAEALMEERIKDVEKSVGVTNHFRAVDTARLFDISFMCVHTPCDNLVTEFVANLFEREKPETVGDIIKLLLHVPEYRQSAINNTPPRIVAGSPSRSAGKIYVDFTGGTSGPAEAIPKLADAGISTIVTMYAPEAQVKAAKEAKMNIVVAGHISSDSIGLNRFLDVIAARGVEIIPTSGLIRVSR
jgi:putative NIF3 family GTP cyclohydrolase 1 type 2